MISNESDNKKELKDLSNEYIHEYICIYPPSSESKVWCFGSPNISIKFRDGSLFDAPVLKKKGEIFDLKAEKTGCIPMSIKGKAVSDEEEIEIIVHSQQWSRIITSDYYKIIDLNTGKSIQTEPRVDILNGDYDSLHKSLPEKCMGNVSVRVSAKGYEQFEGTLDLTKEQETIRLRKIIEKETYTCKNSDGEDLTVTILGPGAKSQSPLRGYKTMGQKLVYSNNSRFAWREFAFGTIAGLAIAFIFFGAIKCYNMINKDDVQVNYISDIDEDILQQNSTQEEDLAPIVTIEQAIDYLDSHDVWEKSELEKYPELQGLFDVLNNMDTYKLSYIWAEKLKESNNFIKVAKVAKKNYAKGWDPKQGNHNPTFNKSQDYRINLTNYTNWLDRDQSPKLNAVTETPPTKKTNSKGKEASKANENKFDPKNLN